MLWKVAISMLVDVVPNGQKNTLIHSDFKWVFRTFDFLALCNLQNVSIRVLTCSRGYIILLKKLINKFLQSQPSVMILNRCHNGEMLPFYLHTWMVDNTHNSILHYLTFGTLICRNTLLKLKHYSQEK